MYGWTYDLELKLGRAGSNSNPFPVWYLKTQTHVGTSVEGCHCCESTQLSRDRIAKETVGFTQGYNLSDRDGEKCKDVLIAEMYAEIPMANQFSFRQNLDGFETLVLFM